MKILALALLVFLATAGQGAMAFDAEYVCAAKKGNRFCTLQFAVDFSNTTVNGELDGVGRAICAEGNEVVYADTLRRFQWMGLAGKGTNNISGFLLTAKGDVVPGRIPLELGSIYLESNDLEVADGQLAYFDGRNFKSLRVSCRRQ